MEWKRAGRHSAFALFLSLPLAGVGVASLTIPLAQRSAVRAARARPFDSGLASRNEPLTTPAGKENVAAWVGRIGRPEGKSRTFRAYCTIAKVDGLVVGDRMLHVWDTPGTFAFRQTPPGDGLTTFDLEPSTEKIAPPEAAKRACAGISYPADSTYGEAIIPMGRRVEVSGCHRKDELTPCRDGTDLVTVRSVREVFTQARSVGIFASLAGMFITGLPLSYLAFAVAGERILLDRRKKRRNERAAA